MSIQQKDGEENTAEKAVQAEAVPDSAAEAAAAEAPIADGGIEESADENTEADDLAEEILAELFNSGENGANKPDSDGNIGDEGGNSPNEPEETDENAEQEAKPADLETESVDLDAQSNDLAAQSNDLAAQSNDLAAQSNDLAAKSKDLATQLAETRDQLLRKAADFENFRKRINQEKQRAIEFANESLLLDIIPIIDDFERAIQSAEASKELAELPAGKVMLDGITMIEKRLVSQLESRWGLKRFISAGEPFDPNIHEAMFMEKSPDVEEPVVAEDLIKGYTLKDRVIRAAKVKVLMPEESEQ